jgi:ATP-dependent DNA helicase RecG
MGQKELEKMLRDLQALPKECEWAEFKVDYVNPQDIGEYLSALSNSACYQNKSHGYLVFGIENETHRLVGTNFRPLKEKIGNQELENWLATQLNPRVDFNISEFEYNGDHFVIFKVDATLDRPVNFRNEPFIRIGSYKKKLADHPERERKIWHRTNQTVFEKGIAFEKATSDDILHLIDYPKYFEMAKLPLPDNRKGILERFVQDCIVEPNGEKYNITNLGGILFAKDLEQFDVLGRKAIRVVVYQGNNRVKTKKEQPGRRGYAVGFEGLVKYILDQFPTNEVIEQALRKEVTIYPQLAIRELVANAIIHQDFSVGGSSSMVELFDNRIEITNPGKPLIDPLRFIDHSPVSRNEKLAQMMRRLNICEERGSGFDKVVFQCELYQLPAPEIIIGDNYTRVILYAPLTLRQMDKQAKIRACYLHACLKYVSGKMMTNQSLRERFGIDENNYPMASRIISDSIKAGLVRDYDPDSRSRKYAKYVPFWV